MFVCFFKYFLKIKGNNFPPPPNQYSFPHVFLAFVKVPRHFYFAFKFSDEDGVCEDPEAELPDNHKDSDT